MGYIGAGITRFNTADELTVTGDAQIDTTTLVVDSTNNRVGIGEPSPSFKLDVNGTILAQDEVFADQYRLLDSGGTWRPVLGISSDDIVIKTGTTTGTRSILFETENTERLRIDSSGNVGIGISSPADELHVNSTSANVNFRLTRDTNTGCRVSGSDGSATPAFIVETIASGTATERMRIDSSGNVLVGKTSAATSTAGVQLASNGRVEGVVDGGEALRLNRITSDGDIAVFRKDNSAVGAIGNNGTNFFISGVADGAKAGILFSAGKYTPMKDAVEVDNAVDIGSSSGRYDDIFATNGTIQTSDQNEKQQIASLTAAEITAAKAISKLFKTFKWNDKVEAKGDAARTHTGVIAQEVQTAMTDAGLDAADYAFWCSDTWWETSTDVPAVEADEEAGIEAQDAYTRVDTYDTADEAPEGATQRTRLGIRYPELLAFIGAATEQRLADIETRLTALEAAE